jgi:hypothetical protein
MGTHGRDTSKSKKKVTISADAITPSSARVRIKTRRKPFLAAK